MQHAWQNRINTPQTSAAGRLFDAAAALTGLCSVASHEGQGPMRLEAVSGKDARALELPLVYDERGVWSTDWAPLLPMLLDERIAVGTRAAMFHASLAETILRQAQLARREHGIDHVGLCGGMLGV